MEPIHDTKLFKEMVKHLPNHTPEDISNNLLMASLHTLVRFECDNPDAAMSWMSTPQGMLYWDELATEMRRNKRRVANEIEEL